MKDNDDQWPTLPIPVFRTLARDVTKVYCDICNDSWSAKNAKHAKLVQVDKANFRSKAVRWEKTSHDGFNNVNKRVDWLQADMRSCRTCHSTFFHESFLISKGSLETVFGESSQPSPSPQPPPHPPPLLQVRSSSRKRLSYETINVPVNGPAPDPILRLNP